MPTYNLSSAFILNQPMSYYLGLPAGSVISAANGNLGVLTSPVTATTDLLMPDGVTPWGAAYAVTDPSYYDDVAIGDDRIDVGSTITFGGQSYTVTAAHSQIGMSEFGVGSFNGGAYIYTVSDGVTETNLFFPNIYAPPPVYTQGFNDNTTFVSFETSGPWSSFGGAFPNYAYSDYGVALASDYIVEGTSASESIGFGYAGDPDGDFIDNNDGNPGSPGLGNDDLVYAYSGDDTIIGGNGDDTGYGGHGNDSLIGGVGNDELYGGAGNDKFDAQSGDDQLFGGGGLDTLLGESGNDVIYGGAGNDSIVSHTGNDFIDGGSGDDTIFGIEDSDTIRGNDGNDSVIGGSGNDELEGNDGNDNVQGRSGDDLVYGGAGNDTVSGSGGNDTLKSGIGNDSLLGGLGDDSLDGFSGDDRLFGGGGNDTVTAGLGSDYAEGGAGNDLIEDIGADNDSLYGNSGDDTIRGAGGNDLIYGGDGNDSVMGDGILGAGTGDDSVYGDAGDDTVIGAGGNDQLFGGTGADDLQGGTGNDSLEGNSGDDLITAGSGDDTLLGGLGNDDLNGSTGNDYIEAGAGNDSVGGGEGDDVAFGGSGDDYMTAGLGNDTLQADQGNDTVAGLGGDDHLEGVSGDDTIEGGTGNDSLSGGVGNDNLYGGFTDVGNDTLEGNSGDDLIKDEDSGDDLVVGGDGVDTVYGGFGSDTFSGGFESGDIVTGGEDPGDTDIDVLDLTGLGVAGVDYTITYGGGNNEAGTVNFLTGPSAGGSMTFSEIENVICFTTGTQIMTSRGEQFVEDLRVGDMVHTLDHGLQPIRWIGSTKVDGEALSRNPKLLPIRIKAGAFGRGLPAEDLRVSPQHRLMVSSTIARRLFDQEQVLVAAKQLVQVDGIDVDHWAQEVEYFHILFDRHEIIFAEGMPAESLYTGREALKSLPRDAVEEIFTLFPELRDCDPDHRPQAARFIAPGRAARKLAVHHSRSGKLLLELVTG